MRAPRTLLYRDVDGIHRSVALLALRAVAGAGFIMHGWPKIQKPFTWMGPDAPFPGFLQFCAAASEFVGGIALIVGLLTPIAALGLMITMGVAVNSHISKGDPFVGQGGSYELAAVYFVVMLTLLLIGPGRFSADGVLFSPRSRKGG